jgi:hypothetical protein
VPHGVIRHGIIENEDGMPISCVCGYNPWQEDSADHANSGPDEDTIRQKFLAHFIAYIAI